MRRRLFAIASACSLVLCIATGVFLIGNHYGRLDIRQGHFFITGGCVYYRVVSGYRGNVTLGDDESERLATLPSRVWLGFSRSGWWGEHITDGVPDEGTQWQLTDYGVSLWWPAGTAALMTLACGLRAGLDRTIRNPQKCAACGYAC
jgi:hypothetical protein